MERPAAARNRCGWRRTTSSLAALVAVAVIVFPTGSKAASSAAPIWRVGLTNPSFGQINPWLASGYPAFYSTYLMFPTLVDIDSNQNVVGDLASSWGVSKDRKVWTFKLRRGGWSDGKAITARDVVFTIRTAQMHARAKDKLAYYGTNVANVSSVRAVATNIVELRLKKPDFLMPQRLNLFAIVPQHVWGAGGGTVDSLSSFGTKAPMVSGGPYSLTSLDGTTAIFNANPHWIHGKVATPRLGIRIYKTDDALVLALKANEIDVVPSITGAISPASLPSSIKRVTGPGSVTPAFVVNFANTDRPELRSPVVRRALSLAINRGEIARLAFAGAAVPESSIVATSVRPWHNQRLRPDPYSPDTANSLLDNLGFARGSDGVRVANGRRMSYTVLEAAGFINAQARTLFVRYLEAVGIETKERILDVGAAFSEMSQHKWDLFYFGFGGGGTGLYQVDQFTSPGRPYFDPTTDTGYRSAQYDRLHSQLSAGVTPARGKALLDQMQAVIAKDRPIIPIVNTLLVGLVRTNVSGISTGFFGAPSPLHSASWGRVRVN